MLHKSPWKHLLLLLVAGCARAGEPREWRPCARIEAPEIDECSGMVRSRRHADVFWVNNDSGDLPRLFALDRRGRLLRQVRIRGARHVDWEEITLDDSGHLYIGDFGNNDNDRQDLVVYVVEEPDPRGPGPDVLTIPLLRRIPFYFPEQKAFPDPQDFNYDCEAMFWEAGNLYLLTKHRSDTRTVLYRLSLEGGESRRAAQRIGEAEIGSQVTAASLSADGRHLLVLSYQYIDLFERPAAGDNFLAGPSHRVVIEGRQCEGISFDGRQVLFTNEQREIYCLQLDDLLARATYLPTPPQTQVAAVVPRLDGTAWAGIAPLSLQAETEGGEPHAASAAPTVRLGWCAEGLLVQVTWAAAAAVKPGRKLFTVMFGPPGQAEPRLQPGQQVWVARWKQQGVSVTRQRPEAPAPAKARSFHDASSLVVEVLLPASLAGGAALVLNVIVADLEVPDREWAWAGTSSTEPKENPLLWGRAVLLP